MSDKLPVESVPTPQNELLSQLDSPYIIYNTRFFDLVLYYYSSISKLNDIEKEQALSLHESISRSKSIGLVLSHILKHRASTSRVVHLETNLPKPTVYKALGFLSENQLIVKAAPIGRGRGRRAPIYAVRNYAPEDLAMAFTADKFYSTPGFKEIRRLADVIVEGYIEYLRPFDSEFLDRSKLYAILKRECKGFRWFDLKNDIEHELNCRGFKVS